MIRLLSILLLFGALSAHAAYVTFTVTFTNAPIVSNTFTRNSVLVTYTNAPLNSTLWIVTNSPAASATNLWRHLGANLPSWYVRMTSPTNVTISGTDAQFSISGAYAVLTTNSAATTNFRALLMPFDTQPYATNRTNDANELLYGTKTYAGTGNRATFFSNEVITAGLIRDAGVSNSYLTNITRGNVASLVSTTLVVFSGSLSNVVLTNALGVNGTRALFTNLTGLGGSFSNATITNATWINGNLGGLSNGVLTGTRWSNGIAHIKSGYASNMVFEAMQTTNPIVWGNLYIGGTASGVYNAWALQTSTNGAEYKFHIYNDDLIGDVFSVKQDGSLITTLINNHPIYDKTTNFGLFFADLIRTTNLTASDAALTSLTTSNSIHRGTNVWEGDISFNRYANASLANGGNAGVLIGTNVFMEVSGPSAAFTINGLAGGRDGKLCVILNQTGFDMTVAHQSGMDPVAANRIINMTGTDRATTGNGAATLIYSAAAARWILISFDP